MINNGRTVKETISDMTKRQRVILLLLVSLTSLLGISFPFLVSTLGGYSDIVSRQYIAGELSDEDVVASSDFSFVDEVATSLSRERAKRAVLPIFHYSLSSTISQRSKLYEVFEAIMAGDASLETWLGAAWGELMSKDEEGLSYLLRIAEECYDALLQEGIYSASSLREIRALGKTRVDVESSSLGFSHEGLVRYVSELVTEEGIRDWVLNWVAVNFPLLSSGDAGILASLLGHTAEVNVEFDPIATSDAISSAEALVPSVVLEVKQGDYILRRDTVVTDQEIRIIQRIEEETRILTPVREILGHLLFTICLVIVAVYMISVSIKYSYRLFSYVSMILVSVDLTLALNFLIAMRLSYEGVRYTDPLLPVLFAPVLSMFITGRRRIGLTVGVLFAGLVSMYPAANTFTVFYVILITVAVIVTKRPGNQRIDLIYHAVAATVSVGFISLLMAVFSVQPYGIVFTSVLCSMVNSSLSFVLVSIVLPVLEKIFNIPTTFRLYELAHTDSPTLTRLSLIAPGTFNHSKNVSEMAYYACKDIGANADLARVAGLYHDIGKAEHPEYFIENQNGKNAHDDLNKTLSAAVIKSHVRLGVEKAKDAGLPQEVIDIIGEHHGNDLIKSFYNAAVREGKEKNQIVSEEDFRYNGTVPQTPESGVVMLADCSEAATRTLKNPNHQKYEKFINSIIVDKINYDQLTQSQLTLNDLILVKEAFVRYLMGRDHHRIEYTPKE